MAGFFLFALIVGLAFDFYSSGGSLDALRFPVGMIVAASVASVNGFVSFFWGSSLVLGSTGAIKPDFENATHKKLHNIVTEMALASGLPMPKVYVLPDAAPNALATGRNPETAAIAVTQGLLDTMTRDELQAVVAHEMGHIKNSDILLMTVVSVLLGTIALISDWAVRMWRYGGSRRRGKQSGGPIVLVIMIIIALFIYLSPIISRIMAMAISRNREYLADASGAQFTRNPLALATALEKIRDSAAPVARAHKGTAHLFISDPLKRKLDEREGKLADLLSTHPPIEQRIERLKKMAYVYKDKAQKTPGTDNEKGKA